MRHGVHDCNAVGEPRNDRQIVRDPDQPVPDSRTSFCIS